MAPKDKTKEKEDDLESHELQPHFSLTISKTTTAYDFHMRNDSIRSVPAKLLLVLAIVNYLFSFAFMNGYDSYTEANKNNENGAEKTNCVIPGAFSLATYSMIFVMGSGSLILAYLVLAGLFKIVHILMLQISPMCVMIVKKRYHNVPRTFNHYGNEFNFECDQEAPCWDKQEVTPSRKVVGDDGDDSEAHHEFLSVELPPPTTSTLILEQRNESHTRYEAEDICLAH